MDNEFEKIIALENLISVRRIMEAWNKERESLHEPLIFTKKAFRDLAVKMEKLLKDPIRPLSFEVKEGIEKPWKESI